jgi:ABC-type branched-subunit amino acid transport system permease subunit
LTEIIIGSHPQSLVTYIRELLKALYSRKRVIAIILIFAALFNWVPDPPLIDIRGTWDLHFGPLEIGIPRIVSDWNLAQIVINSLFSAATYSLLAIGLTLVYRILKFANFAHAEFVTFGAYMAFLAFQIAIAIGIDIGGDLFWGVIIAFILTLDF